MLDQESQVLWDLFELLGEKFQNLVMAIYLEIKSGPSAGQRFPAIDGLRIGRSKVEVHLDDQKISSLHAKIELDPEGRLILADQNSSNGVWVDEKRVKTLVLMPGVVFRVGRTKIQVIEGDSLTSVHSIDTDFDNLLGWKRTLATQIPLLLAQSSEKIPDIAAFNDLIRLTFIAGPQTDEVFIAGFGPRRFGKTSLDFELKDPTAPNLAFELVANASGAVVFTNKEPNIVLLNGTQIRNQILRDDDVISFGETQIKVSFLKGDI